MKFTIVDARIGLEIFDPQILGELFRSIARNYADVLAKERVGDGLFELKVDRIRESSKDY